MCSCGFLLKTRNLRFFYFESPLKFAHCLNVCFRCFGVSFLSLGGCFLSLRVNLGKSLEVQVMNRIKITEFVCLKRCIRLLHVVDIRMRLTEKIRIGTLTCDSTSEFEASLLELCATS